MEIDLESPPIKFKNSSESEIKFETKDAVEEWEGLEGCGEVEACGGCGEVIWDGGVDFGAEAGLDGGVDGE
jgi:hypothetical protein